MRRWIYSRISVRRVDRLSFCRRLRVLQEPSKRRFRSGSELTVRPVLLCPTDLREKSPSAISHTEKEFIKAKGIILTYCLTVIDQIEASKSNVTIISIDGFEAFDMLVGFHKVTAKLNQD